MSGGVQQLERTTFRTSRLLDFVSEKELTLQCGFGPRDWPLVAVKELVDNALDACEEQGIAPEITVTVEEDSITVADNGAGISSDTVDQLLDFSIRVSSREAYVSPTRGAQGNALKSILAMPFVLDALDDEQAEPPPIPDDLTERLKKLMGRDPALRWDACLRKLAEDDHEMPT